MNTASASDDLCDCFEVGQVWETSRGGLWRVMSVEKLPGRGKRGKEAILKAGIGGTGRSQRRSWDAINGWFLYQRKDGTRTGQD